MSNINWLFTARSHCTEPLTARGPGLGVHELSNLARGGMAYFSQPLSSLQPIHSKPGKVAQRRVSPLLGSWNHRGPLLLSTHSVSSAWRR